MIRGPLVDPSYKPQFSGHETFPLKYGWLKKAFDALTRDPSKSGRLIFSEDEAISLFGVGKNMVTSIRYWATSSGIISDGSKGEEIKVTRLGRRLFGEHGHDPYMEDPATSWIVHWHLCGRPGRTTWFWAFSHLPTLSFDRDTLVQGLLGLASDRGWPRVAPTTVKRDVECFLRTYSSRWRSAASLSHEEELESPLVELGLIKPVGKKDGFRMVRGPKTTLGDGVFAFALLDFWGQYSRANTLSLEAIAHEPGSPGRVFLLDEDDLVERLSGIEDITDGALTWSKTAGLKQVIRVRSVSAKQAEQMVEFDFPVRSKREAA
tara:strand:- start:14267 stop:15226 length:960 start_codon:yes stop_codon:yes gene_type:complete